MILHNEKYKVINTEEYFLKDDIDKKGLEMCIDIFGKISCKSCNLDLIIFDAFIDFFIENLERRRFPKNLIYAYEHLHNSQKSVHCLYNGFRNFRK